MRFVPGLARHSGFPGHPLPRPDVSLTSCIHIWQTRETSFTTTSLTSGTTDQRPQRKHPGARSPLPCGPLRRTCRHARSSDPPVVAARGEPRELLTPRPRPRSRRPAAQSDVPVTRFETRPGTQAGFRPLSSLNSATVRTLGAYTCSTERPSLSETRAVGAAFNVKLKAAMRLSGSWAPTSDPAPCACSCPMHRKGDPQVEVPLLVSLPGTESHLTPGR